MILYVYYQGSDRPFLKYLYNYVKNIISDKCYVVRVEFFDAKDEVVLDTIKENHPNNADKCTAEMFKLWLTRKRKASWNQLLEVFREPHIQLNTLATNIEEMLYKGMYIVFCLFSGKSVYMSACVCVCSSPSLLITGGILWHDILRTI